MKISRPIIGLENKNLICQVKVESSKGCRDLWYSLPESFGYLLSSSSDAFLVALLIPAMDLGEDIYIEGKISERLFYNLSGALQQILLKVIPTLRKINIFVEDDFTRESEPASGVATGFSGGIDSFSVLADHLYAEVPKSFRITHLLFNNVGSHGHGGEDLFRKRYERLLPAAELTGLPFLMINSNLDSFYENNLFFQKTHTLRNTSVALLLQSGIGRYMYASAVDYSKVFVGPTDDTAYSDSISLPLLSTNSLDAFSVGSEYTRVRKTLLVADVIDSFTTLDVCANADNVSNYANCSSCWKCLRTLATLEIAGCLERYSEVFDLDVYRAHRVKYFATLLGKPAPLEFEVIQFAKQRNFPIPISSKVRHYTGAFSLINFSNRVFKKFVRLKY